jgi:hypothetical protein
MDRPCQTKKTSREEEDLGLLVLAKSRRDLVDGCTKNVRIENHF